VNGWTVGYGNISGAGAVCAITASTCCNNAPQECQLFNVPGGLIDGVIGSTYPIYSVFGTAGPNPGIGSNPSLGLPNMYGNNFIRINSSIGNPVHNSVSKLSKTFNVTPGNALFQFAFIGVFNPDHACCDAPSMQIILTNATTNSVLVCPNFSVSVPTAACSNTNTLQYYVVGSGVPYTNQPGVNVFNKWKLNSLDLTPYLTQNITIDVIVSDCPYGGHFGYLYFDAQCSPMTIIGNNSQYPAGTPSITLPTCGANGATITLPNGLGPYSWQGVGVPGPYTVPNFTNQTYITPISGTLNAIMNPAGACAPIIRNITVSITPAPNLNLTPMQPSCSNSVASLTGTLTVGATPMTVVHSGPTGTVPVNVTGNTFFSPSGTVTTLAPGIHTITIVDGIGCNITKTIQINPPLTIPSFTVGSPGVDYTLTCNNTPITMTLSNTSLNYMWTSASGTATGNFVNVTQPGNWQVVGVDPASGCSVSVQFTIAQNLSSPTVVITPTVNNITCAGGSGNFTMTCAGAFSNSQWYNWPSMSPTGPVQGTINIFQAGQPGTYVGCATDNITGCVTCKTVQVTASVGVPQFTVTSSTNFTLGCSTKSVTSLQVSTVVTSPTLNVACNYSYVGPTPASPTQSFSNDPNLNGITIPGTYVVYVKDLTNSCISSQSISIIQNTIQPNVSYLQPLPLMTCRDHSMILTGISSNTNTAISWDVPAFPSHSLNPTPNATVVTMPSITGATNNVTAIGVWTVIAVDQNNLCFSTKTVQINQDVRLPKFTITALTNSVINCKNFDVVIVPVITPSLAVALVPTYQWFSPVDPTNGVPGTQFNSTACGQHTATSISAVNGCTTSASYAIACDLTPPAVDFTPIYTLDCNPNPTVAISVSVTGPTTALTYSWYAFPFGVTLTNPNKATIIGNQVGEYGVVITNTLNGCRSDGTYEVVDGVLNVDFTPSSDYGYSPMFVTFQNNSASSFTTGVMNATWSFGNGSVLSNTYTNGASLIVPGTTYTSAGTYSVLLNITKGSCKGTKVKMILVEVPSVLEVPNVFTPNGDKVNDVFRLIAASLEEINATIFDRWGTKVYEVQSGTGNIAWDGKNMGGKDCPAGTYFYIIKAKGKDGIEYDLKGNVSLFR
jgi:gliding motility-associated-like protein